MTPRIAIRGTILASVTLACWLTGQGKMNAYFVGPTRDAAGWFHIVWVWRDTPDCATNHDLCYARSRDLVHWQTSRGEPLELPITLETADVVDPVPAGGSIGFAVSLGAVALHEDGGLTQRYGNRQDGSATWRLDPVTLKPTGPAPSPVRMPADWGRLDSKSPGMGIRSASDSGRPPEANVRYMLRWETQSSNRDRPHPGEPPPPSILRVYKLESP